MQLCKNCTEVYFSLSNGCFGTELMSVCRIAAVLCMQVADVFAENVKCVCRVCFSVKNQICSVQIHIKIIRADGFKAAQHGNGGFLAGFKQQALTVFLQMLRNSAHSDAEAAEIGIIRIFRNKSHMGYDISDAELVGKICTVAKVFDPIVMINPRIIETSGEQTGGEGCLSVPGKTGTVTRPNYVKAIAFNENMEAYEIEATELLARAICHETDHLDGELYVSKVEGQLMDTEEYYEEMDGTEVLDEE